MSRIAATLANLKAQGRKALIPYVTAGDPYADATTEIYTEEYTLSLHDALPIYLLQDDNGQITETHSISAGLDYPGVGPEHAFLKEIGRAHV